MYVAKELPVFAIFAMKMRGASEWCGRWEEVVGD